MISNLTLILVAIIAAIPPTLVAFLGLVRSKKNTGHLQDIHILINSRMDELLKASKAESKAEGIQIGKDEKVIS